MNIPEVLKYGDFLEQETSDEYYKRFPKELSNVPRCVVENWIYRHWQCFQNNWMWLDLSTCSFEKKTYTNDEITTIDHVSDWIETIDYWGEELFKDENRQESYLGDFMLKIGTTPAPIIVAKDANNIVHPDGDYMKTPLQLIEGHMRLAYLRGMIKCKYSQLQSMHEVWEIHFLEVGDINGAT